MTIHSACQAQILLLIAKNITVSTKYTDFANIFSKKSAKVLLKRAGINKHTIKLVDDKQPPYRLIYSLGLVELKIFKILIKINLSNSFIQLFKFSASVFIYKPDSSLCLYINY